ncbi:MAG: MFS transporter [Cyanobacteria bacterium]|nr:MFS transporter [Cyanobacteria bacterium CG_2015-16_32_12]NCO77340.1 MFS transporter [Cyanobacteria bacterium CG_2015-22_32_23]NCQ04121.1 MFS transporter [Cyanobacteria bacterium CG_2015-09_32_10]NCQ42538.1 MFS transporter [Cyanobacteria bacterium CG_2015-04_32_10]NCS83876.1 MFS transporter [Cyanobacteria bacterium CG_2015-02_32_10]
MSNFQNQLDNSKLTRSMGLLWILSAGLIALDGFDFFIIGIALPFLEKDFNLTSPQIGAIAVAAIVGSLIGSLTLGAITDKIGRQKMLLVDIILFVISSAGTALAWNVTSLIFFRFLVGVAIGADYPISVAYITENVPSRLRGKMVIGAFAFQGFGALFGALTGIAVISGLTNFFPNSDFIITQYSWRLMLGIGLILSILVGFLRLQFLLESPVYYIAKEDYKNAELAARELLESDIIITSESEQKSSINTLNYGSLFSKQYLKNTLFTSFPWFLQDIATYGIGIFTPTIIALLAFNNEDNFIPRQIQSAQGSAIVDIFLIMGFIIAVLLVDKVGRISLQITGFIGMALGLSLLAISGDPNINQHPNFILVLSGFFIYNLLMNAGPNSTTFLLSGEVFPSSIRASGAGFAAAVAKLGAVLGTFLLPIIKDDLGVSNLLYILAFCCLLGAIVTYLLRIETK